MENKHLDEDDGWWREETRKAQSKGSYTENYFIVSLPEKKKVLWQRKDFSFTYIEAEKFRKHFN